MIGPIYTGEIEPASLAYWDELATALEQGGVDGFVDYIDRHQTASTRPGASRCSASPAPGWSCTGISARWREALREMPASRPFGSLEELEALDVPALVVASHDEADPGHPYAVAAAYAERLAAGQADQRGSRGSRRSPGREASSHGR